MHHLYSFLFRRRGALLAVSLSWATGMSAAIVVSGPVATAGGAVRFTQPITFHITTTGVIDDLVLDEWVTSDGTRDGLDLLGGFDYKINGVTLTSSQPAQFFDNAAGYADNDVTSNDGYLKYTSSSLHVTAGDTFSLLPGRWTITSGNSDFNSGTIQTFTGNVFLVDNVGHAISNTVAVPEPAACAVLAGLVVLGFVVGERRRRKTVERSLR